MIVSIVIPAYDEVERLPHTVDAVLAEAARWPFTLELVLVDDGSSDGTLLLMQRFADDDARVRVVSYGTNRGKGAAVAAGVAASRGDFVVFFDADLSYPLAAVPAALTLFDEGADVVIGARDLAPSGRAEYGLLRKVASTSFNAIVEAVLHLGVRDTQCGFKAFRGAIARALFPALEVRGFGFDVELLYLIRRWQLDLRLLPLKMNARAGSSVSVARASAEMLRDVLRIRLRAARGRYPAPPIR